MFISASLKYNICIEQNPCLFIIRRAIAATAVAYAQIFRNNHFETPLNRWAFFSFSKWCKKEKNHKTVENIYKNWLK